MLMVGELQLWSPPRLVCREPGGSDLAVVRLPALQGGGRRGGRAVGGLEDVCAGSGRQAASPRHRIVPLIEHRNRGKVSEWPRRSALCRNTRAHTSQGMPL